MSFAEQLTRLQVFLDADELHDEALDYVAAHGYLTALSICAETVPEREWIDALFAEEPHYADDTEREAIESTLLALKARGENIDEQALSSQTQAQEQALRASSTTAVESFMLFAYRRMPSAQLADYAALYEEETVALLLERSLEIFPELFAARRAQLRK